MDNGSERMKFRKKDWWKYLISLFLLLIYLFPFYIIINVSLKDFADTSSRIQFPDPIYWGNFEKVISAGEIFTGMKNSLIITVLVLIVEIVLGCMAGYALSRNQSKVNEVVRSLIMSVMMITPLTILVGIYSTMSNLHATSTYWGMVLVLSAFGLPMSIFLYTNFISSIPVSLDEAAAIDGAGNLQIFFRIILPQLKTVTVTVMILQGVGVWNEYTYSYYFLQKPEMRTITLVIKTFFSAVSNDYGAAAATAVIGMLPLIVVYLCLQKYFIQGQMDSAIKS
ncbi:ABC transporter, permease protein [Marvinbryantia formatexigens DSM 14469]|uniref:ABC transporter, permease protein n=1 Tax=Marvinbryantia formatexigens DSM 14469 TaxID=478749 RepID=C6LAX6_9FIRM|nr:carbohydrate ABC transporter permease [Marvinbryantia formatexigens]EET62107.1 ABC transporter, permease protein [Marvinbryantia formatexigens DSM 14469]UWO26977.1 carbohydrate ABC transporter permease [Marvinbryantia formatexigens DSM 14469]SDF76887.1 raffinose/stachyose/melibiose transport system permease protein [Marvinbryantia formatexigens]